MYAIHKSMVTPVFAILISGRSGWLALIYPASIWGTPRAMMRVAPDDPKNPSGFI